MDTCRASDPFAGVGDVGHAGAGRNPPRPTDVGIDEALAIAEALMAQYRAIVAALAK